MILYFKTFKYHKISFILYFYRAPGICVLNKRYQNEHFDSFVSVIKQFFKDAGLLNYYKYLYLVI